jgi:hypothetical protein
LTGRGLRTEFWYLKRKSRATSRFEFTVENRTPKFKYLANHLQIRFIYRRHRLPVVQAFCLLLEADQMWLYTEAVKMPALQQIDAFQ